MLPLTLPRRHRRRLLLPPGLLALAWLLWLGCVALPQVRGMRPQHVMEVNFPSLYPELDMPAEFRTGNYYLPYSSPTIIEAFRPWQTFAVTGSVFGDYFALRSAQVVFSRLETDSNHNWGLQVQLGKEASYSSLIQLLDWCSVYNTKRYWVDIRHEPTTLYVFTDESNFNSDGMLLDCGVSGGNPYTSPVRPKSFWAQFDGFITDFWWFTWLAPFLAPDWRNSMLLLLLLLLIGFVSAYRLGRGWWVR